MHLQSLSRVEVQISAARTSYSLVSLQQIPVERDNNTRKTFQLEKSLCSSLVADHGDVYFSLVPVT